MKAKQSLTPQEFFLKKQKQRKTQIRAARIFLLIAFLILWEAAADFGWIDSFIFSSPTRVVGIFWKMSREQGLFFHIGITLAETLISFFLVILFSVGVSVLLWLCPRFSSVMEPYLVVLNSLPKSAMAPLLIVWLGANMRTIVVAGMSVAIFGSIISLYGSFKEVDPDAVKLIYTLGGKKKETLFKVILPSSVPFLLSIFKVNIGLCLVGVVIGEFIGARSGLGYLIIYGSQVFQLNMVIMCIIVLCIIATFLYIAVSILEKQYLKKH